MTITEQVRPERGPGCKVHRRSSGRNLRSRKQCPTAQFEIWRELSVPDKIPLEIQWVHAHPVSSSGGLEEKICRNRINRVFESAPQESRQMRAGQYPTIAQACVPDAGVAAPTRHRMPCGCPHLKFCRTLF